VTGTITVAPGFSLAQRIALLTTLLDALSSTPHPVNSAFTA